MGAQQPFLYEAADHRDGRFPEKPFDPKAVTRASYTPKQSKPKKQDGPLLSFNRHPDAHMVLSHRSTNYRSLSPRMKGWIKGIRVVQLILRLLQLVGAAGILTLFILFTNVHAATGWIIRVAPGIVMLHCGYGAYHMSRSASGRSPASSAAYQLFAGISDICVLPVYGFGVFSIRNNGSEWANRLNDGNLMQYFLPAAEYTLTGAGGLHILSIGISCWLGFVFHKIASMPPDLNPLEDRFTSRASHKRNKSSIATTMSVADSEKRLSTPLEDRRRSGMPYQELSRPPTIPFLRTRANSGSSQGSRASRSDLPSRQYQIMPVNSPRNSVLSLDSKRLSQPQSSHRGSYQEISLGDEGMPSRPGSGMAAGTPPGSPFTRAARFTETWSASDSLISRTQQRNRMMNSPGGAAGRNRDGNAQPYEAVGRRYNFHDDDDSDQDENNLAGSDFENEKSESPRAGRAHPEPLRSNPPVPPRVKTPYYPHRSSALSEVSLNARSVSGSEDADENSTTLSSQPPMPPPHRHASVQRDNEFFSKPYGQLKPATPPVMVGSNRQVSSGNDYDNNNNASSMRRNVSGKMAEEGRAGPTRSSYSRFSVLNE